MTELVVAVAIGSIAVAATALYSGPWMSRETVRGAAYDVQGLMQLARMEAASRNHDCRFVVDTASGDLRVLDTLGTGTTSDDVLLHRRSIPPPVRFARPDVGDALTLAPIGGTESYETVFTAAGTVSSGAGGVFLRGDAAFVRVEVHAAGGVEISRWNHTGWQVGL